MQVIRNFDLPLLESNPAMLEMFKDRDRKPLQSLLPWSGEFIGKYLTHCTQLFRSTASTELKPALGARLALCFKTLIKYQSTEGYIGPWPTGMEWNTTAWDT